MKTAEEIVTTMELRGNSNLDKFEIINLMESYAQQESEKAVREFKEKLLDIFSQEDGYIYCGNIELIIEKLQ